MRNETVFGLIKDLIFQLHLKYAFRKLYHNFCKIPAMRGILSVYKFITSSVLLSSTNITRRGKLFFFFRETLACQYLSRISFSEIQIFL